VTAPTLNLRCRPSRHLRLGVAAAHALAAFALLLADLSPWLQAVGLILLALSAAMQLRRPPDLRLRLEPDGRLEAGLGDSPLLPATVLPKTHVSHWLCVLHYRIDGQKRTGSRAVLPDCLTPDEYRRFKVWLKWRAVTEPATGNVAGSAPDPT
jgi:hypothetical protein